MLCSSLRSLCSLTVLLLPPSESFSSHVRLEFLYGTKFFWPLMLFCPFLVSALMTSPSVDRDLFMLAASRSLSAVAPVLLALSLPAKSTKLILLVLSWKVPGVAGSSISALKVSVKTA